MTPAMLKPTMTTRALDLQLAMTTAAPFDALADLAAAAGYEDRGDRAAAEFYLGLGLAKLGDERVAPASVAGLLRLIAAIAQGTAAAVDRR